MHHAKDTRAKVEKRKFNIDAAVASFQVGYENMWKRNTFYTPPVYKSQVVSRFITWPESRQTHRWRPSFRAQGCAAVVAVLRTLVHRKQVTKYAVGVGRFGRVAFWYPSRFHCIFEYLVTPALKNA